MTACYPMGREAWMETPCTWPGRAARRFTRRAAFLHTHKFPNFTPAGQHHTSSLLHSIFSASVTVERLTARRGSHPTATCASRCVPFGRIGKSLRYARLQTSRNPARLHS
ncbi:hypothetical protein MRX96_047998 [Rhipicephalus microplus]